MHLGPLFCNALYNDAYDSNHNSKYLLFVDDLMIYRINCNVDD